MSIEIPPAFVDYVEQRGGEVHLEPYPEWTDDEGTQHPAGEQIWIRKTEVVRGSAYLQAMTVSDALLAYPERWEMLLDLLDHGLQNTIRRKTASLN